MNRVAPKSLLNLVREPLAKKINLAEVEKWSSDLWRMAQCGRVPDSRKDAKPYVMMFPPPNVTGDLHLGHALTASIQDAIIRHRRMTGYNCTFIPGFDHAGLATQNIIEKIILKEENVSRTDYGKENLLSKAKLWTNERQTNMRNQLDRLGLDLDRDREYFTMDKNSSRAVHAAFKQLFEQGIIYRASKPIWWSNELQTTLSDIEVETEQGVSRYFRTGEIVGRKQIPQWFISTKAMTKCAIAAVKDGQIGMLPEGYKNSWYQWLSDECTEDWCISRQSWWGHSIPAYRIKSECDLDRENWIVADNLEEAKLALGSSDDDVIIQDPDVLDTWFSSSLLPLTVSGWPDKEKFAASCNEDRFPLHLMETGFDILTFWVSKMVMISIALTGRVPFKFVLLHGMICDSKGKKMSKSIGNVIDPLDVMNGTSLEELQNRTISAHSQGILSNSQLEPALANQKKLFPLGIPECGADGLRAYLLSHDVLEEVVKIQMNQLDKIRRFSNKATNIQRFIEMIRASDTNSEILAGIDMISVSPKDIEMPKLDRNDRMLLKSLAICVESSNQVFERSFEFHRNFIQLELFWSVDMSHKFLVNSKDALLFVNNDREEFRRKFQIISLSLVTSIKLLHPYMPHLTEFLYQRLYLISNPTFLTDVWIERNGETLADNLLSRQQYPNKNEWSRFLTIDA